VVLAVATIPAEAEVDFKDECLFIGVLLSGCSGFESGCRALVFQTSTQIDPGTQQTRLCRGDRDASDLSDFLYLAIIRLMDLDDGSQTWL
jgi:hypothetical protein